MANSNKLKLLMTRQEQLQYCTICSMRKLDLKRGLVCSLTNEFAAFVDTCPTFEEDLKEKADQLKRNLAAAGHEKSGASLDYKKNKEYGAIIFFVGVAVLLITMAQSATFGGAIIPTGAILFGARKYLKGDEQEKMISKQRDFDDRQKKI